MERLGTVAIVGVGLIGGSIGLALRARGLASRVLGVGRNVQRLERARQAGAIDLAVTSLAEGVREAQVIVICTPVNRIPQDACQAAAAARADALITDAGSTKRRIVESVEADASAAGRFVGAHPIAGSEQSGPDHARADLFADRVCVLTPTPRTSRAHLARAGEFWTALGCRLLEMNPAEHDEVLAYTSHLPHALAAALASSIPADWLALAAGAFRDGTRVAAADTDLWTAVFRDNRGPLLRALGALEERVATFKYAVMTDDEDSIRRWWDEARQRRGQFDGRSMRDTP